MRLRFWIDSGLQTFAAAIGACGFYALLMYIQLGSDVQDLLSTIPVYLLAFGGIMLMVMNIGVYKFHLHLALSFGSTRNEAILGLNLFRLIPAVLMTATLVIMSRLPGSNFGFQPIPLGLGVYLFFGALGTLIGIVFTKYGKIVTVITAIAIVLCCGAIGFFVGMSGSIHMPQVLRSADLSWLIFCIGIFVYAIMQIPEQRTVWNCNVKL